MRRGSSSGYKNREAETKFTAPIKIGDLRPGTPLHSTPTKHKIGDLRPDTPIHTLKEDVEKYSPDQPRANNGKWSPKGGGDYDAEADAKENKGTPDPPGLKHKLDGDDDDDDGPPAKTGQTPPYPKGQSPYEIGDKPFVDPTKQGDRRTDHAQRAHRNSIGGIGLGVGSIGRQVRAMQGGPLPGKRGNNGKSSAKPDPKNPFRDGTKPHGVPGYEEGSENRSKRKRFKKEFKTGAERVEGRHPHISRIDNSE